MTMMTCRIPVRLGLLGLAAALPAASAARTQKPLPLPLELVLSPHESAGRVDFVDVRMTIAHPDLAAGAVMIHMPLVVASIPTQRYDGGAIRATDARGGLPLTSSDETPTPFLSYRDWKVSRSTAGDVTLTYRAVPRAVNDKTRNGPLFDLREESGGLDGAGFTFIAPPVRKGPYAIHLHWDLSGMPAGSRGIWSLGEGDVDVVKPAGELATTFYYAGPVKSYPPDPSARFHMYWLSRPPFDAVAAARMISKLFDYTSHFFHDRDEPCRVFVRRNPYAAGGGTALTRSFLFAYGTGKKTTKEELEGLIAHEMVHNWPTMDGDHADTSWYTEGTAEYYSILLSYRAGLSTPEELLKRINERADGYYQNPLQSLPLREAEKIYWTDARAGHVPYGRGWIYLASVDAQVRARTGGKRTLDDVVLALVARTQRGEKVTTADWENAIAKILGPEARSGYRAMVAGRKIVPPASTFAPCFERRAVSEHQQDLGFDVLPYMHEPRIIRSLKPRSAAARAGLREGDKVISGTDVSDPSFKYDKPLTIEVERDSRTMSFTFTPLGQEVTGYRWVRNAHVPDSRCRV
jgi:hypothetical protein